MNKKMVKRGLEELNALSRAEYQASLADIMRDPNAQHSAVRVGRLVGVLLKQPFADPQPLSTPSQRTGAYRAWNLVDAKSFYSTARTSTWQHQALENIRQELSLEEPYWADLSLYQFAVEAHHEKGFFGLFARTLRRYICGDQQIRKKVEDALTQARKTGSKLPPLTPEAIVGAAGLTLGVYLVQAVPILGMVGAPVVAAVVVILYTLGVDAFCQWSEGLRTDVDEKY